jgi:hypothetical protein
LKGGRINERTGEKIEEEMERSRNERETLI